MTTHNIVVFGGDHCGPEVVAEAVKVCMTLLQLLASRQAGKQASTWAGRQAGTDVEEQQGLQTSLPRYSRSSKLSVQVLGSLTSRNIF